MFASGRICIFYWKLTNCFLTTGFLLYGTRNMQILYGGKKLPTHSIHTIVILAYIVHQAYHKTTKLLTEYSLACWCPCVTQKKWQYIVPTASV